MARHWPAAQHQRRLLAQGVHRERAGVPAQAGRRPEQGMVLRRGLCSAVGYVGARISAQARSGGRRKKEIEDAGTEAESQGAADAASPASGFS